jgi:hypothetical protein
MFTMTGYLKPLTLLITIESARKWAGGLKRGCVEKRVCEI